MIDEPENRIMTAFKESHLGSELAVTKIECTSKSVTAYTLSCFFPPSLALSVLPASVKEYRMPSTYSCCSFHLTVPLLFLDIASVSLVTEPFLLPLIPSSASSFPVSLHSFLLQNSQEVIGIKEATT